MTISKTKTVKEVVSSIEIETPLHIKFGHSFYKVVENGVLWIYNDGEKFLSQLSEGDEAGEDIHYCIEHGTHITADEFNQAACEVHNRQAAIQLQKAPDLGKYNLKQLTA